MNQQTTDAMDFVLVVCFYILYYYCSQVLFREVFLGKLTVTDDLIKIIYGEILYKAFYLR